MRYLGTYFDRPLSLDRRQCYILTVFSGSTDSVPRGIDLCSMITQVLGVHGGVWFMAELTDLSIFLHVDI